MCGNCGCKGKSSCCCEGCDCECTCCGGAGEGGFKRRYQTKSEQMAELEYYLKELKAEVQAVEERLADLKRKRS